MKFKSFPWLSNHAVWAISIYKALQINSGMYSQVIIIYLPLVGCEMNIDKAALHVHALLDMILSYPMLAHETNYC